MSKKHFIALADTIREANQLNPQHAFTPEQIQALAEFCRSQNYDFKEDRWMDYIAGRCGKNGGAIKQAA